MRIFKTEELIGEWSSEIFRITLFNNSKLKIHFSLTNNEYDGTFKIFENFIVLNYIKNQNETKWVLRIDNKKYDKLELTDLSMNVGQKELLKKTYFNIDVLKKFDFDRLENITINEIKAKLHILSLTLNVAKDKNGFPTNYLRHWNNEERYSIIIEKNLVEKIKDNYEIRLEIEKTIKNTELGYYTFFKIIEYFETEYFDDDLRDVYDDYYYNTSNWLSDAAGTNDPEVMNDVKWNLD